MPDPNDLTRFDPPDYGPSDAELMDFYELASAEKITEYMRDFYARDLDEQAAEWRAEH